MANIREQIVHQGIPAAPMNGIGGSADAKRIMTSQVSWMNSGSTIVNLQAMKYNYFTISLPRPLPTMILKKKQVQQSLINQEMVTIAALLEEIHSGYRENMEAVWILTELMTISASPKILCPQVTALSPSG